MVEGCDIWLNNPRRPLEASGTSGMKVIANGGLNFSVLDGWWDEGYEPNLGWAIGNREEYDDLDYQDEVESRVIYDTLEKEIVPAFYERSDDKLPRRWISMMKNSMKTLGPVFNTNRMVEEYFYKFYLKSYETRKELMKDDWKKAKEFAAWKMNLSNNWNKIKFESIVQENKNGDMKVGDNYVISADIDLAELTQKDVDVQIYFGKVEDNTQQNSFVKMKYVSKKDTIYKYKGEIPCDTTGHFGFTLRILPDHPLLINAFELGLIKWAGN